MLIRGRVVMVAMLIGAPALASWINEGLSPEEAHQIRRLAIVSGLRDEIHGRLFGLTRFQNKEFDVTVPGWDLDAKITKDLAEQIVAGGKLRGEVIALAMPPSKKRDILSEAQKLGFDAVLAVAAEQSVPDRALVGGVMLLRQKKLGSDRLNPCAGIVIRIWRVRDGKQIGFTAPDPCDFDHSAPIWHDKWEEFSDVEKQATVANLEGFVFERMNSALVKLRLHDQ
jgi:hypothetical protein